MGVDPSLVKGGVEAVSVGIRRLESAPRLIDLLNELLTVGLGGAAADLRRTGVRVGAQSRGVVVGQWARETVNILVQAQRIGRLPEQRVTGAEAPQDRLIQPRPQVHLARSRIGQVGLESEGPIGGHGGHVAGPKQKLAPRVVQRGSLKRPVRIRPTNEITV